MVVIHIRISVRDAAENILKTSLSFFLRKGSVKLPFFQIRLIRAVPEVAVAPSCIMRASQSEEFQDVRAGL